MPATADYRGNPLSYAEGISSAIMRGMKKILLTGATGFIGKALTRHLSETDFQVRALIHPSGKSPDLPKGIPVEATVSGLNDIRGLRAALVGVDTVYHLASQESLGARGDLLETDIKGTRNLVQAAQESGVDRFVYLSHLGADRASAYPVMTAKAIAEDNIRKSSLDYTILRIGVVFGPQDRFTTALARMIQAIPLVFPLPDQGDTLLQPLWIEDLSNILLWTLDNPKTKRELFEIAGPEQLSFRDIVLTMLDVMHLNRKLISVSTPLIRFATVLADYLSLQIPTNIFWLDYLATNRTCSLNTIPHIYNLLPSHFSKRIEYLRPIKEGK
jgi:nucleoside-diphosphate-sugar epimerase